jgi:hypothetical protein
MDRPDAARLTAAAAAGDEFRQAVIADLDDPFIDEDETSLTF